MNDSRATCDLCQRTYIDPITEHIGRQLLGCKTVGSRVLA